MNKFGIKLIAILCCLLCSIGIFTVQGQNVPYNPSAFIEVNINSGDPAFPYPQFLEYPGGGKSLAKYNAEGVTHADMEKAGREAYEIMTHRCRYFGGTHCGVKYIVFNPISNGGTTETSLTYPDVPGAYGTFCSEGDGYILLAAALFADQKTYNGLYMWIHDNRFSGVKRFKDGKMFRENKKGFTTCPYLAGWGADETTTTEGKCHSATDGDVDIALATLIAYKQWGEFMKQDGEIVRDANGDPISYLYEAQRCIGALVDTVPQWEYGANTLSGYLPGVIGIDGYTKDGVAQGEVTRWRFSDAAIARYGNINGPYNGGPVLMSQYGKMFADYDAPAYYDEFYKWFKEDGAKNYDKSTTEWRVHQFQKAAASGNWITKMAYEDGRYASIGSFSVGDDGSNPTFGESGLDGEDFRFAWRHLLDYLWHGETAYDWDPKNHSVIEGQSHDGVKLMGIRHAQLLKDPPGVGDKPGTSACAKLGASPDAGQPMWSGVVHNPQQYNSDGTVKSFYHTNYSIGAGSPAAVIAEDQEFLNDMYRSLELRWDGNNTDVGAEDEERYIGSTPKYFHGWYRTLGMLVCQGNMHAPANMKSAANMKVYMSVDKTYAYVDDQIDYTVQYRNYGSAEATGVKIETEIDPNYEVVSISNGGKFSGGKIVWNIGTVPGFKTGHLAETIDSVSFRVIARDTLNPRICLTSKITGSNFDEWVSNEYPNHATYTMERNCVDILANRTLTIDKKASRKAMNPGDVVAFTVEFENKSEGESSWLNGGRDNVRLSYGNYMMSNTANLFYQYYRFWNDAYEAYINLGNYRVSYFMYDAASIGLYDNDNPTGWQFELDNGNDMAKYGWMPTGAETKFTYQKMPNGEDEHGKWNQRIMIQFPSSLMAASAYVYDHLNNAFQLHKGGYGPCFFRTRLGIKQAKAMYEKVKDDWSYSGDLAISALDGQTETFTLITPGWANYDNPGYEITNYARNICNPLSVPNYDRVLIEEFDGYTWRRIQGTGPLPGREANNVTIVDTIPYELEWVGWKDSTALKDDKGEKIKATYTPAANPKSAGYTGIVKWTTPVMLVGEKDKLIYMCKARDLGCPNAEDAYYMNVAWISSQTDSPDSARVELMTTCAELPPVIDEQTCLFKTASVKKAMIGDDVSYKVKFVNNIGSKVDANCKDKSEWVALNKKSLPDINGGLVLSKEGGAFAAPKYSWGKDGEVYATIENAKNTESIFLVFRYVSGTPGQTDFKGVAIKMKVNLDNDNNFGYELYNDSKLVAAEGTSWQDVMQFKGSSVAPTFKFVLRGEKLYMYCNDEEDEWENVMKDWSGLTSAGPGYFGIYTARNNGTPTLTKFITELDYAFDVTVGDYLPSELEEITDITPSGEYDKKTGTIKWPTVEKVAPGDSLIYTFDARVKECEKYINNYAFATAYGVDSLKALNTVECGEVECDLTDAVASLKLEEICEGDSTYIKAVATPKSKGYTYEFFNGKTSLNDDKPIKVDSFFVKEAGSYSVTVYNEEIAGCKISSKSVKLTVNPLPDVALENGVALCDGEGLDLSKATIEGYDLNWYSDDVAAFEVTDLNIDGKDVLGAYFYTATDKTTKCVGKVQMMEVSKEAIPDVPTVTSPKEFAVGTGKEDITKLASSANGRVVWYESKTATDSLRTPVTISVAKEDTIVYYVSAVSKGGCESERDSVVIYITSSNKPKVSDTTLCVGEKIDVTTLVEAPEAGQSLIWCDETGTPLSEPTPFESATPGETKYYVKSTNGTAESDIAEITITTVGVGTAKTDDVSYCEDATAEKLVATTDVSSLSTFVKADDPSKFEWYLGGVKLDESALIPSTSKVSSTTTNTYKVVPTYTISSNHVCKGDTADLDVTVKHIDAPAVNNVITYTLGDTLTDGSFKSLLTQDPSAVTPGKDMTLVWYDENMSELKSEPIPSADKSMTTDVKLKYYVSQKDADGCESVLSDVDVIVSLTPVPKTKVARFCEDYLSTESIEDFVEKSDPSYSLKWYDADKSKGGLEISMPAISTTKTTKQPTDTTVYYVCQVDDNGAESSTVPVRVILYARPELKTHFDTVCSRAVNLDTMWIVSNDVSNVYSSFTDESGNPLNNYNAIDKTGHYNVTGYFKMPNDTSIKCESNSPKEIYVEIHRIDSLSIVGAASACPGASVELSAVLKGDTYNSDITYTWNTTNKSTMADAGNFVSEPLNDPTKFEVTVSDGFCEKTVSHTVKIGQGEVNGSIIFTDEDGNTEAISAHGDPISFYSCGTKYSLFADLESDANDFKWSTGETSQAIQLNTEGEYVVTFTNECETSQKVKVVDAGIKNNTVGRDTILCEGAKYAMTLDFSCKETPTVEWKKDGVEVGTSNSISISSASTSDDGKYTYTITNRNCIVEETYGTLTVSEAPKFTKIADDTVICEGSDAQIGLSELTPSTATIEWNSDATLVGSGMMAVVNPTATTTYRFTVSQAGGCEVKDSIIVEVEEPIEFTVSPTDTIVCMTPGSVRLFTNVSQGKPRKYTWTNEAGDVLATSPIYKAPTDVIGETVYTVSLSNEICETVTAKSTIKVVGYPEIASVNQKGYRDIEIVPLKNNESTNVMYKVDNSEYQTSEAFTDLKYGTHTAYIIDEYGCQSDFQFVTEAPGIEFPTVITPNGDGVNDAFISEVVAEAYPDAVVTIYDRFGKKLTEIKGSESWDGTYLGRKMPATDYWYEIWIDEIRKKYVGHFTLINE
ncbi:MAG: glycosyl hydrolase family 8 [Bacteroidales bacterium]|nr:glycosyl hydrolase family 8 [Bacteroidales bacterium]